MPAPQDGEGCEDARPRALSGFGLRFELLARGADEVLAPVLAIGILVKIAGGDHHKSPYV
jgi:hypothetical protein